MNQTPQGWETHKFGELFNVKHGYAFKGKYFSDNGKHIVLTPGNFYEEGGFKPKSKEKYYTGDFPYEYLLSEGDLLVAMTEQAKGLLGSSALIPKNDVFLHNQRLGLITHVDTENLDKKFLYYLFNTYDVRAQIQSTASGTKVRHTSPSRIAEVEVTIPSVLVQRKIAAILAAYDDLIENNTRRIAILEEMAQLLYREWFVRFRFPSHEGVAMVDSEIGEIPEGWSVVGYDKIAEVLSGGTPRTKVSEYWSGPIPFYSPRDFDNTFYVIDTERSITELGLENCSSDLYPKNTVFISARGTVGNVTMPAKPMGMNQSCYALIGRKGIPQYYVFLSILNEVHRLRQRAHGAVFDTIIMDTFKQLKVVQPPKDLIHLFVEMTSPLFELILSLLKRNVVLKDTRDLLLPRLISGELDVSDLAIANQKVNGNG
jgi:type I restriction enzyme S subunit